MLEYCRGPVRLIASLLIILGLALGGCRAGGTKTRKPPATKPSQREAQLTPEQRQKNLKSFDQVWTTVRDKHWDPTLGGLDWNAVRDELRPRVEQSQTMSEARAIMQDMIGRLKQSHFGIIPASVYQDVDVKPNGTGDAAAPTTAVATKPPSRDGVVGIDLRVLEGKALVTEVEPDLPAARAGVKPGWIISRIGGREVEPVIGKMSQSLADEHMLPAMLAAAIEARLRGEVGKEIDIAFLDARDRPVSKSLAFVDPPGTAATFGNLPTFYVTFESRRLEPNIGYIAFSAFFDPASVMGRFQQAIEQFQGADGIILDLRGNPGGLGVMGMGMGGFFVSESNQQLGTMRTRSGELHFVLNPRVESYTGPLAILVDGSSMSTAEILAGGLQDLKRARVFGTRTPGAALPSIVERLPNGDGFQYAFANYTSVGGQPLEGRGVQPDEVVELDRKSLLRGRDPVIEAAVRWIESQAQQKRT